MFKLEPTHTKCILFRRTYLPADKLTPWSVGLAGTHIRLGLDASRRLLVQIRLDCICSHPPGLYMFRSVSIISRTYDQRVGRRPCKTLRYRGLMQPCCMWMQNVAVTCMPLNPGGADVHAMKHRQESMEHRHVQLILNGLDVNSTA